jgi:hypothetical protein
MGWLMDERCMQVGPYNPTSLLMPLHGRILVDLTIPWPSFGHPFGYSVGHFLGWLMEERRMQVITGA